MEILNTTALRNWGKENKFPDTWWFTINGGDVAGPAPIYGIPREGQVLVLNDAARGTANEQWFIYRYPGFKTGEEMQKKEAAKKRATEKQIVALEFFGYKEEEITKDRASEILDGFFNSGYNYGRYQEYVFDNLDRLYSGHRLAEESIRFLQEKLLFIRENVSQKSLSSLVEWEHWHQGDSVRAVQL